MSAVAAIPCPLASPSTTASSPSGSAEEVVDVTTDLDAGRRLVDGADLEPFDLGEPAREQRALHRVGEVLPLLVQARVVDRERRLPGDEDGGLDLLVAEPPSRIERDDRQRGQQLGRGRDRDDERGRALLEERDEELVRLTETRALSARVDHRAARSGAPRPPARARARGAAAPSRGSATYGARGTSSAPRPSSTRTTAASASSSSTAEVVTASSVASSDRLWANEREISYSARSRFADSRSAASVSWSSAAWRSVRSWSSRVLRGHGQLGGERRQERRLVRLHLAPARQVDGEQSDRAPRARRAGRRARRRSALRPRPHARERAGRRPARPERGARPGRAVGPNASSSRRSATASSASAPEPGLRPQPVRVAEVDRDTVRAQQLGDARDGGLQRVRERELGDRLADDREQRVGPFELERRRPRALAGTQRLRRANGEGAQPVELALATGELPGRNTSWRTPSGGWPSVSVGDAFGPRPPRRGPARARPAARGRSAASERARAGPWRPAARARLRRRPPRAAPPPRRRRARRSAPPRRRRAPRRAPRRARLRRAPAPRSGEARPAVRRRRTLAGRARPVRRRGVRRVRSLGVEAPARPQQLEAAERDVAGPNRDQQHVGGASPAGGSSHGRGKLVRRCFLRGQLHERERSSPRARRRAPRSARRAAHRQPARAVDDATAAASAPVAPTRRRRRPEAPGEPGSPAARRPAAASVSRAWSDISSIRPRKVFLIAVSRPAARLCSPAWPSRLAARNRWTKRWSSIRLPSNARTSCIEPAAAFTAIVDSETKRAKLRFWIVLFALVAASVYLSIVIWHQIQRTFGL